MGKAARRARRKRKRDGLPVVKGDTESMIQLANPVRQHFDAFIVGNSNFCEHVVEAGSAKGRTVAICGAGPSLKANLRYLDGADDIWGCNSAAIWLHENDLGVTHGFTVDQTAHMVVEWKSAPDIEYLLASSVHPHLTEHLLEAGRTVRWFHNFVSVKKPPVEFCECGHDHARDGEEWGACIGVPGLEEFGIRNSGFCGCEEYRPRHMDFEMWLYAIAYPETVMAGSGLNSVNRAIDIAMAMEYEEIRVLGADCCIEVKPGAPPRPQVRDPYQEDHVAWLKEWTTMHVDDSDPLRSEATPLVLDATIDGRYWLTKTDMVISAQFLRAMALKYPHIRLIGDTLPNALLTMDDDFIERLPMFVGADGKRLPIEV